MSDDIIMKLAKYMAALYKARDFWSDRSPEGRDIADSLRYRIVGIHDLCIILNCENEVTDLAKKIYVFNEDIKE